MSASPLACFNKSVFKVWNMLFKESLGAGGISVLAPARTSLMGDQVGPSQLDREDDGQEDGQDPSLTIGRPFFAVFTNASMCQQDFYFHKQFFQCGEFLSKQSFILSSNQRHKCQLLKFVLGQAMMAVYESP